MKSTNRPASKPSSAPIRRLRTTIKKPRTGANSANHMRLIARQVWLLYLHSRSVRLRLGYLVLSKKYKRRNVCELYCTTYASRQRCEHLVRSPWTHFTLAATGAVCALIIVQLAYPGDRVLPLARLQGQGFVGFESHDRIQDRLVALNKQSITVETAGKTVVTDYAHLGVKIDEKATLNDLRHYSFGQRLIPFSIFVAGNKTVSINRQIDDVKLEEFMRTSGMGARQQPRDAAIKLEGTKLIVEPAQDGYEYSLDLIKQQLLAAKLQDTTLIFKPKLLSPGISSQSARETAQAMQNRIDVPLTIQAVEVAVTVDSATLASWIDIAPSPDKAMIELSFNKNRVAEFLRPLPASIDRVAKPDVITLLNGAVAGSVRGSSGRMVKLAEVIDQVANSANSGITTVWANVTPVLPEQQYDRRYSRDSQGIQSLIEYWAATHKGQHGIDFWTLNGRIAASFNPHKQFTGAASNKLFIAHLISGRLDAGSVRPSTPTASGANVTSCMDRMLRLTDTACSNDLGAIIGWGAGDSLLRTQGFQDTTLVKGGGVTSASDIASWFSQLLSGGLTSFEQKNFLLDTLSRQTVRMGIPSGSTGIFVVNKAGAAGSHVYDAGIIYHPRGAYVLSVLSDGGSFAAIAELTSQINKTLNE